MKMNHPTFAILSYYSDPCYIFTTEHFGLRLQVYLRFPEFLKVELEAAGVS